MKTLLFIMISLLFIFAGCEESSTDPNNNNNNPPANEVFMINNTFSPSSITVAVGTTIKWTNKETVIHTVTSGPQGNPSGLFNSGNVSKDQTFSFKFDSAGTFPYHCMPHPGMIGTVTVQ